MDVNHRSTFGVYWDFGCHLLALYTVLLVPDPTDFNSINTYIWWAWFRPYFMVIICIFVAIDFYLYDNYYIVEKRK